MMPQGPIPIKRRSLLASLTVLAGGLVTHRATPPAAGPAPILLLESHVAGTAYYDANKLLGDLSPGRVLSLRRQPDNRHDDLAIEVLVPGGGKLGYVPRAHNQPLARLMDAGKVLRAEVLQLSPRAWDKVWLQV